MEKVLTGLIENTKETERAYVEDHKQDPDVTSEKLIDGLENVLATYKDRYVGKET